MAEGKHCLYCGVAREAFADEASWIEHWHRHAVERREQRAREAARKEKKPKLKDSPAWRTLRRMKAKECHRRRYREQHEAMRAYYNAYARKWREANPERAREMWRRNREAHREERNLARAVYYREHREESKAYHKAYRATHREQITARIREWRRVNPEKARANERRYYLRHYQQVRQAGIRYRAANREKIAERKRAYAVEYREERLAYYRRYNEMRRKIQAAYNKAHRQEHAERERARRAKLTGKTSETQYRTRADIQAAARALEEQVVSLRAEGWTWSEVAELLDRKEKACVKAYRRAMKRRPAEQQGPSPQERDGEA